MQTIDELLGEIDVFRGLADEHLDLIAGCALNRVFAADEYLLRENEQANTFFAIRHGTVALETYVPQRGAVTIETLHGGDMLGWSWLFPPYRWAFGAVAAGPVEAFEFDGRMVRACCESDPALGYELTRRLARVVAKRLQATRVRLITASGQPAGAR
jgi:CRP/FNR family transcriptional regulator, cyclic AMP receptor protein